MAAIIGELVKTILRCVIYTRISLDGLSDEHGVENQLAVLKKGAEERGWTVVAQLRDNDIGVSRKDPTMPGEARPGWDEVMRMVDAREVDVVYGWSWDRGLREPLDLEYAIPRFDRAGSGSPSTRARSTRAPSQAGCTPAS
jgi:site-specific DNA recombinase